MTFALSTGAVTVGSTGAVTLIRGAELVAAPWKNGGGVTREVAAFPAHAALDTFIWRVSVADVAQAGPFSRFAGIDRTLVLLSGAGMLLDEAQCDDTVKTHALTRPLDIARFNGEAPIDARLVDGATRDFNLMVHRESAQGELEVWRAAGHIAPHAARHERTLSADVALLYCANGPLAVTLGNAPEQWLQTGDALRIDTPNALPCKVEGTGALLAISIRYAARR
ncbi:HutD/Ves family protein [Paraburkholderia dilworthii]|uniref:HutD/Ves family protein n=1 Tax=Paraburkholderia dilworthii TaxID=948106 RepID=UPI000408EF28|nr:HutD family protein [Paraburkholderia dilworthii]